MRLEIITAVLAVACLLDGATAQETTEEPAMNLTTTPAPVFGVVLKHKQSSTSSIIVEWESHKSFNDEVEYYWLVVTKKESDNKLTSPQLNNTAREFEVEDLMADSYYLVCLYTSMHNSTELERCEMLWTIPLVRDDSLIVLFCVLGYVLLMILLGYLCWRYAKKKAESDDEVEEEEEKEGQEALLGKGRPESAGIDDTDIPYITPPISEIEKEKEKEIERSKHNESNATVEA